MREWIIALGILALAGTAVAQGDVVAQRREGMKRMAQHMQAVKAVVDNHADPRGTAERIDDMLAWYPRELALFPAGSDAGDTKALPAVWTDRAGFEQSNATLVTRLQALRRAADAGDEAGFAAAFQQVGAACGGCHRAYRQPTR